MSVIGCYRSPPDVLARNSHLLLQGLQAVPALPPPKSAEITYPTVWGNLTFEALYNRVLPYAILNPAEGGINGNTHEQSNTVDAT